MGKRKIESKIRVLINEYRKLQKSEGREKFPGDPYRMKYNTLKSRIDGFVQDESKGIEDIKAIEETNLINEEQTEEVERPVQVELPSKNYSDDFVSISEALSKPSIPIQPILKESEEEIDEHDKKDLEDINEFDDGASIDESISFDDDFEGEPQQSFMPLGELASLITDLHDHIPLITSRMYAKVIMEDKGTFAEARLIDKKVRQYTIDGKEINLSEKERELYELYSQVEDYKENSKPNEQTKLLLKRAWEIQLRKWGYDNIDVDKHSLAFAYGLLGIQLGLPFLPHIGKIKFRKKNKK